jgi:hypothetical protein
MYENGSLALTGAGLTIFGVNVGLGGLVAGALALVLLGVVAYRFACRGRRYAS